MKPLAMAGILLDSPPRVRQPPEKQAFRGVYPHPGLILCTLLPLLGTLETIPPPSFLSNSTIATNVGYQTLDGYEGYTFVTPTFGGIGDDYSIQDVKISGENVTGGAAQSLQVVDAEGNVQDEDFYGWCLAGEAYKNSPAGWYTADFDLAERTFSNGQGFLLSNDDGEYVIQFAGQVIVDAIPAYDCETGYTSVGNMTPIAKDIQKFALAGENVTGGGAQSLQILDSEGNVQDEDFYGWCLAGEAYKNSPAGWYTADFDLAERDIEPGQAFLVSNDEGESTISIPGTND